MHSQLLFQQLPQQQQQQQQGAAALLQQLRSHVGPEGLALLNSLEQQVGGNSGAGVQQQQQSVFQAAAALQQPALQLSGNPFGFLEPTIGRLPATAAALGYRTDMGR
jgi:hypothetical protein